MPANTGSSDFSKALDCGIRDNDDRGDTNLNLLNGIKPSFYS